MEDVKHEQLLMLTFSRSATEFKKRLLKVNEQCFLFYRYQNLPFLLFWTCWGKVGNLEKSEHIIEC